MSTFLQQTFLGASIRNFNASMGWGNQTSTLTVSLVEDSTNGDVFSPASIGNPVSFNYMGWIFNGLLQSWRLMGDSGGNPLYEVQVVDPREILEGVQIILSGYTGITYQVPNVINAYGWWENQEFGAAQVNNSGMPWRLIAEAVQSVTALTGPGEYGGAIRFINANYTLNMLSLPQVSDYYRVGGDVISVMDFINEICEAANCDFFVTMDEVSTGIFTIQINTVSRRAQQELNVITNFIASLDGVTSKSTGFEFLNNPTGKFLVGGQKEDIFFQFFDAGVVDKTAETYDEYSDDTIWPFWGFDAAGNAILGIGPFQSQTGVDDDGNPTYGPRNHKFFLDSRLINVIGVGAAYPTDVNEMISALNSYEAWELYLSNNDNNPNSNQYKKATKLGITSIFSENLQDILNGSADLTALKNIHPMRFAALTRRQANIRKHAGTGDAAASHAENIMRLYDYVRNFASQYYGRRFMVRIPYVYVAQEPDTDIIKLSQEPVDSGFIDEETWPIATQYNLLPARINDITNEDGKILAFVRFDNADTLDLSELSPDDYVFNDGFTSVFVKCNVIPGVCYLDAFNLINPRAVVELPGPVRTLFGLGATNFGDPLIDVCVDILEKGIPLGDKFKVDGLTDLQKREIATDVVNNWMNKFGNDLMYLGTKGEALIPQLAAIPLKSNIDTYGPWYSWGIGGKMEYEKDDTLVPWNYGGFDIMNDVADAKINETLANQLISEAGTIEFPGIPTVPLGAALLNGGPNVTDIRVSISETGATTTYQMQLSPRFGKFAKQNADRIARLGKLAQKQRRQIRSILSTRQPGDKFFKQRENGLTKPLAFTPHSTQTLIASQLIPRDDIDTPGITLYGINTIIAPQYNIAPSLVEDYSMKSVVSLDAIFVPFATSANASGMPTSSGNMGFYLTGTDPNVAMVARGDTIPESGISSDGPYSGQYSEYRSMAYRVPMMLAGWGTDTSGNPVPSAASDSLIPSGLTSTYAYKYWQRPDLWKVGPLDVVWSDNKQKWTCPPSEASSSSNLLIQASAIDTIIPYGSGMANINDSAAVSGVGLAISWLGQAVCAGQRMFVAKDPYGNYNIVISEFSNLNIITNMRCVSGVPYNDIANIYIPSAYTSVIASGV